MWRIQGIDCGLPHRFLEIVRLCVACLRQWTHWWRRTRTIWFAVLLFAVLRFAVLCLILSSSNHWDDITTNMSEQHSFKWKRLQWGSYNMCVSMFLCITFRFSDSRGSVATTQRWVVESALSVSVVTRRRCDCWRCACVWVSMLLSIGVCVWGKGGYVSVCMYV